MLKGMEDAVGTVRRVTAAVAAPVRKTNGDYYMDQRVSSP